MKGNFGHTSFIFCARTIQRNFSSCSGYHAANKKMSPWRVDVLRCPSNELLTRVSTRTTRRAACDHWIFERLPVEIFWHKLIHQHCSQAIRFLKDQSWKPRDALSPGPLQNCLLRKLAFSLLIHFQNFIESDHQVTISDGIPKNLTSWNNFA